MGKTKSSQGDIARLNMSYRYGRPMIWCVSKDRKLNQDTARRANLTMQTKQDGVSDTA